jgi:hypothetical protein
MYAHSPTLPVGALSCPYRFSAHMAKANVRKTSQSVAEAPVNRRQPVQYGQETLSVRCVNERGEMLAADYHETWKRAHKRSVD